MRSHAKHAGNYASSVSCANKNDESTVVPTQHNYVHLNFTNLNGRTKYKISFVEKKKKELSFFFYFLSAGQTIFLFLSLFIRIV